MSDSFPVMGLYVKSRLKNHSVLAKSQRTDILGRCWSCSTGNWFIREQNEKSWMLEEETRI